MHIRNLSGIFTGEGFVRRDGRRVRDEDCSFSRGPIDLFIDSDGLVADATISDDEEFDGTNMLALPGFVDPHTHAIFAGQRSHEYFMRWAGKTYLEITQAGGGIHSTVAATRDSSDTSLIESLRSRLRAMLECGASVIEVKSGYANSAVQEMRLSRLIRDAARSASSGQASGESLPQVRASFLALHALPKDRKEDEYVDEMIAALPEIVAEKLADHVDTFPEKGFFTRVSCLRFSEAARKLGLPCKVHADELCDLGSSAAFIRAGALSIDHLQHINDEAVSLLSAHSTVATMLPATSFFVGIPYANARRLIDAGARVALATDFNPGTAPAHDLQLTHMLAASQMKMSAAEILCASTYNAAAALGLERTNGALLPGRVGDVLLYKLDGAISNTGMSELQQIILSRRRPDAVLMAGHIVFES